jgi:hypothetical protein
MSVHRIAIQQQELDQAIAMQPDTVLARAGRALSAVMAGHTVIIEEMIGAIGDEDIIEETVIEAERPS